MPLTEQQKAFADYLLTDPGQNATQAYLKAYPKSTAKAAESSASDLLRNPKVAAYLDEERAKRSERTRIDADWLLRRLAEEAEADVADLYDERTGALKPVRMWPKIWRTGLVAGVEVDQQFAYVDGKRVPDGVVTKVKLSDRVKRLQMIGDHIGVQAFKQNINHSGAVVIFNNDYGKQED